MPLIIPDRSRLKTLFKSSFFPSAGEPTSSHVFNGGLCVGYSNGNFIYENGSDSLRGKYLSGSYPVTGITSIGQRLVGISHTNAQRAAFSDDNGKTWTLSGVLPSSPYTGNSLAGNGTIALNLNVLGDLSVTTDGDTWALVKNIFSAGAYSNVLAGSFKYIPELGIFAAVAGYTNSGQSRNLFVYSSDGVSWTTREIPNKGKLGIIEYLGGSLYLISGADSTATAPNSRGVSIVKSNNLFSTWEDVPGIYNENFISADVSTLDEYTPTNCVASNGNIYFSNQAGQFFFIEGGVSKLLVSSGLKGGKTNYKNYSPAEAYRGNAYLAYETLYTNISK